MALVPDSSLPPGLAPVAVAQLYTSGGTVGGTVGESSAFRGVAKERSSSGVQTVANGLKAAGVFIAEVASKAGAAIAAGAQACFARVSQQANAAHSPARTEGAPHPVTTPSFPSAAPAPHPPALAIASAPPSHQQGLFVTQEYSQILQSVGANPADPTNLTSEQQAAINKRVLEDAERMRTQAASAPTPAPGPPHASSSDMRALVSEGGLYQHPISAYAA
jgi:hypothetical protein